MTKATNTVIVLTGLEGNTPIHLKGMQVLLAPYVDTIIVFWWAVFVITVVVVIVRTRMNR